MTSTAANLLLMCSRRAGKTRALCGLLLLTAIKTANCSSLYLALTAGQAEKVWRRHWLPMLRRFKVPCEILEGELITRFPNGAQVVFGGTNNLRTLTHLLGDSMAGGIAIFDEQQSDPGVLEEAVVNIVGPMVEETTTEIPFPGRQAIAGTVPDDPIGYFWELWTDNYDEQNGKHKPEAHWQCFAWSRFENPHEKDNQWHMENYCKKLKLAEDDPIVLRNWKGIRVWDTQSKCFGYRTEVNRWEGKHIVPPSPDQTWEELLAPFKHIMVRPPNGIDRFWVGIDPAQSVHRFALELFGTCSYEDRGAWHLAEAVTDPGGDPWESQWLDVIKQWKQIYSAWGRFVKFIRDPGSSSETNDVLLRTHGILIESAIKGPGSLKGRVEHTRELNMCGDLHVLKDSELEVDFIKTAWSKREKEKGKWEYDPKWHPDPGDAATYILPAWTAQREKPDPTRGMSEEEKDIYEARESFLKRYREGAKQKKQSRKPMLYKGSGRFQ